MWTPPLVWMTHWVPSSATTVLLLPAPMNPRATVVRLGTIRLLLLLAVGVGPYYLPIRPHGFPVPLNARVVFIIRNPMGGISLGRPPELINSYYVVSIFTKAAPLPR